MTSDATTTDTAEPRRGSPGTTRIVAAILTLVLGLAVLAAGIVFFQSKSQSSSVAELRDSAADAAAQVVVNAFSFDHRNVDESMERMRQGSTGDFLAEQEQWADEVRDRVVEQKAVTQAVVSNTAVTEIESDPRAAGVIVVFTATSEREGEDDITGRQAMKVDLVWEDDRWKAAAVNQVGVMVPVGTSSASVQELDDLTSEGEGADEGDQTDADTDETETDQTDDTTDETGGN